MPKTLTPCLASYTTSLDAKKRRARTRSGCLTCRIRRVKCDEAKPSCFRCISTGRKCDGYAPEPLSRTQLAIVLREQSQQKLMWGRQSSDSSSIQSLQHSSWLNYANETEKRYFDLFRSDTARISGGLFSPVFWESLVLQVSHRELAIKHGIIALGALHRRFQLESTDSTAYLDKIEVAHELVQYAMEHYGQAVGYAKKLIADVGEAYNRQEEAKDIDIAFIACIIFVCYENLAGNYTTATMHLRSGLRIFEELERRRHIAVKVPIASNSTRGNKTPKPRTLQILPALSPTQSAIDHLFRRLDLQALWLPDLREPYVYEQCLAYSKAQSQPMPRNFARMQEAGSHLFDQIRWLFKLGVTLQALKGSPGNDTLDMYGKVQFLGTQDVVGTEPEHTLYLLKRCERRLEDWYLAYQRSFSSPSAQSHSAEHRTAFVLQIYHTCALMIVQVAQAGRETAWDKFLPEIQDTIGILEKLAICHKSKKADTEKGGEPFLLSLDIGIIFPLFLLGSKCRDPLTRRRVVSLLSMPPRMREGQWDSLAAVAVIQRVIEIEERETRRLRRRPDDSYDVTDILADGESFSSHGDPSLKPMTDPIPMCAEDIPEQARVCAIFLEMKNDARVVDVDFAMRPDTKQWMMRRERVPF
ncbi:hypothetical protein EMCG_09583 [[Emmonsia] crescens]|uniref:Zn(2)-C6 fungal-type domain-containing protein n=1 Tax=[Emmonsia] crescens TaxID=73230 RepID=A0A0G2I2Q0_9EURO|nr:hypothetical protein EMCG_09583 [Emmonsia crescens UAMH 3008]